VCELKYLLHNQQDKLKKSEDYKNQQDFMFNFIIGSVYLFLKIFLSLLEVFIGKDLYIILNNCFLLLLTKHYFISTF